jgi:hypothetical protein
VEDCRSQGFGSQIPQGQPTSSEVLSVPTLIDVLLIPAYLDTPD